MSARTLTEIILAKRERIQRYAEAWSETPCALDAKADWTIVVHPTIPPTVGWRVTAFDANPWASAHGEAHTEHATKAAALVFAAREYSVVLAQHGRP